jgi:hypothetical protein
MKTTALSSLFLIILTILPCQFHSVTFAADDEGERIGETHLNFATLAAAFCIWNGL